MKWYDPICVQLYVECLTATRKEAYIDQTFGNLLLDIREYIDEFKRINDSVNLLGFPEYYAELICSPTKKEAISESRSRIRLLKEFDINAIIEQLKNENVLGCQLRCFDEAKFVKKYSAKSTAFGRRYVELIKLLTKDSNSAYLEEFVNMLNCAQPDLQDVVIPISMVHTGLGGSFFVFYRNDDAITDYGDLYTFVTDNNTYLSKVNRFHHKIAISLPRFMLRRQSEIELLQTSWTKTVQELAKRYTCIKASIDMDVRHDFAWNDTVYLGIKPYPLYFAKYVTGYPWCMVLSKKQHELLKCDDLLRLQLLYHKICVFENGTVYCQLTEKVDYIDAVTCQSARELFRKLLPPYCLRHAIFSYPVTFRGGLLTSELKFDRTGRVTMHA